MWSRTSTLLGMTTETRFLPSHLNTARSQLRAISSLIRDSPVSQTVAYPWARPTLSPNSSTTILSFKILWLRTFRHTQGEFPEVGPSRFKCSPTWRLIPIRVLTKGFPTSRMRPSVPGLFRVAEEEIDQSERTMVKMECFPPATSSTKPWPRSSKESNVKCSHSSGRKRISCQTSAKILRNIIRLQFHSTRLIIFLTHKWNTIERPRPVWSSSHRSLIE